MSIKQCLEGKLFDALVELQACAKKGNARETQRIFGVVLGLRIALMELNKMSGVNQYGFAGYLAIEQLIRDGFGQLRGEALRNYGFPEF